MNKNIVNERKKVIADGRTTIGIELGSTRIKAVLMDENVREGVMNRIEYKPVDVVSGVLIYRLMLDDNINAGRLIYKE